MVMWPSTSTVPRPAGLGQRDEAWRRGLRRLFVGSARADRGGVGREEGVAATADRGTGDMCTVRGLLSVPAT